MDAALTEGLQRRGPLARFPSGTESRYRRWAAAEALPVIRVLSVVSIPTWLAAPLVMPPLGVDGDLTAARALCWGVSIPTLVIGLVIPRYYWRTWLAAWGLLLLDVVSLLLVVSVDVDRGPSLMVTMAVFGLYLAPLMRLPVGATAIVLAPTVPAAAAWALRTADREGTGGAALNVELWLLGASSVIALAMTAVMESSSRQRYADEQLLERQQALLSQSRDLIRRYAPSAVVERLEQGDATVDTPQRLRVTVLFADVVGFTAMADRVDPEALAEIMDDYLGAVADLVERHGGTLSEFAGDGVMVLFGAPEPMEAIAQVRAALAAATELQQELPRLSERWHPLGIGEDLRARVGINTGVVSVGTFGSAVRATYTGMGMQTNIAARVQAHCPPGSVLLSSTSWHLVKDEVPCASRGEVEVKGVHFPIAVYEPVAARSAEPGPDMEPPVGIEPTT